MTDTKMHVPDEPCKVAAAVHRQQQHAAQADLGAALVGGSGHRVPVSWDRDPLMQMPKRRRKRTAKPAEVAS